MRRIALLILLLVLLSACAVSLTETESTTPSSIPAVPLTTSPPAVATGPSSPPVAVSTGSPATNPAPSPTPSPPTPTPSATLTPAATATPSTIEFAVIGDYGLAGQGEADVAALVDSWQPDFIITVGDNNYPNGEVETIDQNIGQYYAEYIYPYYGQYTTTVSVPGVNRFFPSLGNHDYYSALGVQPYLDYFTLPGNERYYDFTWGPVHLFALNSDFNEPDGVGVDSLQAQWLQEQLAASTAPWKLVYMHVPPYSSGHHGSGTWMQWPFQEWGATAVLAGHDHHYERLLLDGMAYFVNGLGGGAIYAMGEPLPGSQVRFTGSHGAMRVAARPQSITFEFVTPAGEIVDSYTITR